MTELLYMADSYLREWDTKVARSDGRFVAVEKSAFFPEGGGVPSDRGTITRNGEAFNVVFAKKMGGDISLEVDRPGLEAGDAVRCELDWQLRYKHMKMHTSAHIIDAVLYKETGALCTGNQIGADKTRIDFSLDEINKEKFARYIEMTNEIIERNLPVRVYFLKREEALKIPGIIKLANAAPPDVSEFRIVEIGDVDTQADGGPHVASTKEIGRVELLDLQNKGKNNRRLYYALK